MLKHRHRLVPRERHNDTNAHPHLPHIGDRRCRKSWKESPVFALKGILPSPPTFYESAGSSPLQETGLSNGVNRDKTTQRDLRFGGSKTI
jgi:hypothetical protein